MQNCRPPPRDFEDLSTVHVCVMEVESRQNEEEENAVRLREPVNGQPASFKSSDQSLELRVSSSDNLTFTKAKIRSDEEHLILLKGYWNSLQLSLLLFVLLVSTVCAILLAIYWTGKHEAPFDYAMVFDAGSTHTSMLVYKWQADKFHGTGLVSEVASCSVDGGIGKVLRQSPGTDAAGYFNSCVTLGLSNIPEDRRSHSPLLLGATAGMRLVRSENPEQATQILNNVSRTLEQMAGPGQGDDRGLLVNINSVRIISGQEEAVSGWISANYLLRTIYPRPTKMVGMLDMGGASTQITFVHHDASGSSSIFDESLMLYGARHELYARSYMCFGQEQLHNRYLVLLVKDLLQDSTTTDQPNNRVIQVTSPCHNVGYNFTVEFNDYVNVCSETKFTEELRDMKVDVVGSSNAVECKKKVTILLNTTHCDRTFLSRDCFAAPAVHSANTNFVAVSGFYYVMDYLGFTGKHPSVDEFSSAVVNRCNMTWDEVKANAPGITANYLSQVCFNAVYQSQLLLEGYGIKDETWKEINFVNKVNGASVGWTLGFTIRTTNAFPDEPAIEPFPVITFTVIMFLLAICIGITMTLTVKLIMKILWKNNQINVK